MKQLFKSNLILLVGLKIPKGSIDVADKSVRPVVRFLWMWTNVDDARWLQSGKCHELAVMLPLLMG